MKIVVNSSHSQLFELLVIIISSSTDYTKYKVFLFYNFMTNVFTHYVQSKREIKISIEFTIL